MKLKIKKLFHNKTLPAYQTKGAAGMDLCAAIDFPITLKPMERKLIPTGIKIELEHGYEAQIRPRSGLSIKHGITLINCVGTIDEDYRGEVCIPIVNVSNEEYTIQPDERIAQMVINKVEQAEIEIVEELSDTSRGEGGFGSTGSTGCPSDSSSSSTGCVPNTKGCSSNSNTKGCQPNSDTKGCPPGFSTRKA